MKVNYIYASRHLDTLVSSKCGHPRQIPLLPSMTTDDDFERPRIGYFRITIHA